MYNCQNTLTTQCLNPTEDCGVNVVVTTNNAIVRVCDTITYTITVTNNSDQVMRNTVVTLPIINALALQPGTVTLNGETVTLPECTYHVVIGDLPVGETATITYDVVVMECQRYLKTKAKVNFLVCCCFARRNLCVTSAPNCVQVCRGCCCGNNSN